MSSPLPLEELFKIYPADLRTDLVGWATDKRKPPEWAPPKNVEDHLVALFEKAHAAGRRKGIVTGLLVCWLPAILMIVVGVVTSGGHP